MPQINLAEVKKQQTIAVRKLNAAFKAIGELDLDPDVQKEIEEKLNASLAQKFKSIIENNSGPYIAPTPKQKPEAVKPVDQADVVTEIPAVVDTPDEVVAEPVNDIDTF